MGTLQGTTSVESSRMLYIWLTELSSTCVTCRSIFCDLTGKEVFSLGTCGTILMRRIRPFTPNGSHQVSCLHLLPSLNHIQALSQQVCLTAILHHHQLLLRHLHSTATPMHFVKRTTWFRIMRRLPPFQFERATGGLVRTSEEHLPSTLSRW